MELTFGLLDAFAFVVFAVILAAIVIIIVSLGQLPGRLARKWGHPQAAAINVASWVGIATGGLVWPLAFIWAFMVPTTPPSTKINEDQQTAWPVAPDSMERNEPEVKKLSAQKASRS
jgi:hypothetical protein